MEKEDDGGGFFGIREQDLNKDIVDNEPSTSESYRRAAERLGVLLNRNAHEPVRFAYLGASGSPHTRRSFLAQILEPLTEKNHRHTLIQALDNLSEAADKLSRFGIYETVSVEVVDLVPGDDQAGNIAANIRLKERSRMWLRTGTDFGNQEGNAYASANIRNLFGGAESLEGNMSLGTRTKTSYEAKLSTPVRASPDSILELLAYSSSKVNTYASHDENTKGLAVKLRHLGRFGVHELGLIAADRSLTRIHDGASLALHLSTPSSRKISVLHSFSRDRRENSTMPGHGYRLRSTQEIALGGILGSQAAFVKCEVDGSKHVSITKTKTSVLNLSFRTGILWSPEKEASISDRFQLGGPQSVRGFMYQGLGPRSGKDSLGGDAYFATGISLLCPIPKAPAHWPVSMHTFLNSGSLLSLDHENPRLTLHHLLTQQSVSLGIGLAFRHPAARIEVNFSLPIISRLSDRSRKGLQFGLGVDFL